MADPSSPRREPTRERGMLRAFGLAALVHGLLLALLTFGVQWQSRAPRGEEAELWDEAAVQAAGPAPKPAARAAPARIEENADIALARQSRKREREAAARAAEPVHRAAPTREEAKRRAQPTERKAQQEAPDRRAASLRLQERAKAKAEAEAQQRRLDAARADAERRAQLDRMRAQAGAAAGRVAAGSGGGAGSGMGTGGAASAGYAERVRAKVKPNIVFDPEVMHGNPTAVVDVQMAPDGAVLSRRLVKSSGNAAYDEAVMRAVARADPLPRDIDGRAPPGVRLMFRPRE